VGLGGNWIVATKSGKLQRKEQKLQRKKKSCNQMKKVATKYENHPK
jgi:hypothetical protein